MTAVACSCFALLYNNGTTSLQWRTDTCLGMTVCNIAKHLLTK